MTDKEILAHIGAVAEEHLLWRGELRSDMVLAEVLDLDSLRGLILAVEVENRFQICLDADLEAQVVTVGDLVAAIRSRCAPPA